MTELYRIADNIYRIFTIPDAVRASLCFPNISSSIWLPTVNPSSCVPMKILV